MSPKSMTLAHTSQQSMIVVIFVVECERPRLWFTIWYILRLMQRVAGDVQDVGTRIRNDHHERDACKKGSGVIISKPMRSAAQGQIMEYRD